MLLNSTSFINDLENPRGTLRADLGLYEETAMPSQVHNGNTTLTKQILSEETHPGFPKFFYGRGDVPPQTPLDPPHTASTTQQIMQQKHFSLNKSRPLNCTKNV